MNVCYTSMIANKIFVVIFCSLNLKSSHWHVCTVPSSPLILCLLHYIHVEWSVASWTSSVVSQSPWIPMKSPSCSSSGISSNVGVSIEALTEKMGDRYMCSTDTGYLLFYDTAWYAALHLTAYMLEWACTCSSRGNLSVMPCQWCIWTWWRIGDLKTDIWKPWQQYLSLFLSIYTSSQDTCTWRAN